MDKINPFNEQVIAYDAWFEKHTDIYLSELAAVRSLIPNSGSGVEIGVGTGRFAMALGISIGVEPAPRMAELSRMRGIEVFENTAENLPFANSSFDFATMVTVVCFLNDVSQAFNEANRIIKTEGSLVVGFIDRESYLGQHYKQKKEQSPFYRNATFYSVSEIETLLMNAGFFNFFYRQTLLNGELMGLDILDGHGIGGFVVIKAYKR